MINLHSKRTGVPPDLVFFFFFLIMCYLYIKFDQYPVAVALCQRRNFPIEGEQLLREIWNQCYWKCFLWTPASPKAFCWTCNCKSSSSLYSLEKPEFPQEALMGIQVPGGELQSSPEIFVATFHHEFLKNFWRLADTEHYTEHGVVWLQATIQNRLNFPLYLFYAPPLHHNSTGLSSGQCRGVITQPCLWANSPGRSAELSENSHHLFQSHSAWQETNHSLSIIPSILGNTHLH